MARGAKTLIVGLDGATWDLADRFMAEGRMPNLARLVAEGAQAPLDSTRPPMTLPSWSSMLTGCNPGRHGIFDFVRKRSDEWLLEFTNATHRAVPTLMRILSDRGGKVASIAVPTTWPPEALNGVVVSGFDGPVSTGIDASFCEPRSVYDEIKRRFGGMKFADFQETQIDGSWHDAALDALLREIPRKTAIAEWLMSSDRYDCFMLMFGESDTVSHHFWMFHDEASPRHDSTASDRLKDAIGAIYSRLDQALGELIDAASPEHVCVVSDHGFGGASIYALYLNRFLEMHGWLSYKREVAATGLGTGTSLASRLRSAAATMIPADWQGRVYRAVPDAVLGSIESQSRYGDIDFEHTRAVSDEMNYAATIRLNFAPDDHAGRAAAVEELTALLLSWQVDGHCPVRSVSTRESLYDGPRVSDSPELILELNERDGYSYTLLPSARVSRGTTWRTLAPHEFPGGKGLGMNGTHRQHGVLSLWGKGVAAGVTVAAGMPDVAPTLLHLMGVGVPEHMDGQVIAAALDETSRDASAPAPSSVSLPGTAISPSSATPAEAAALRARLERLGYL
jgi:predicted AlkP superfamily phosphohydrolase/phosphomutase